ncbi:MAG: DEAD/DEAH box helicase family protein [Kiritimatiellae bacterium]|nr:DEAD/DEAH box helicase family protein [Kiritimatiellia bacterium]
MMQYEQRPYQQEAIKAALAAFTERGRTSVLLESPVGSGKTYMALEVIHRLQEHLGRPLKIGWVAPRHHLLRQMMEANRDLHGDNIRPVSLFEKVPPEVELVVLDEAHHEATQSCVLLYERMHAKWTIGLSATPMRTDRMKLSFQETVRTCSIGRLVREGYLSPFNTYVIPNYSVDTAADFYLAEPARWGKSLVFFSTIAECVAFRERLAAGGVACEVVTGESDKESQIEAFANGRVQVVANVAMLTEGFDQPDVMSIFARDASRLPTIQMCGRGLRRAPGKVACNIVQSANSNYLFERVASPRNAFRWQQDQWLALTDGTEAIEQTLKETLRRMTAREKADRAARKSEFRHAAQVVPQKFTRKIQRLERAEKAEKSYYSAFGGIYDALVRFRELAYAACWNDAPGPCAIHLNKGLGTGLERVTAIPNFLRDGDRVVPALAVNLRACVGQIWRRALSHRRFAVDLLKGMIRLKLLADGHEPSANEITMMMEDFGYNESVNTYRRGTPFVEVLQAADKLLPDMLPRLRLALMNPYSVTSKGDARYYLRTK